MLPGGVLAKVADVGRVFARVVAAAENGVGVLGVVAGGAEGLRVGEAEGVEHAGGGGAADGHADADHGDGHFGAVPEVEDCGWFWGGRRLVYFVFLLF